MRALRALLLAAAGLVALAAVGVSAGWVWLRGERGQAWLLDVALSRAQPAQGRLAIGALRTDLWTTIRADAVVLLDAQGRELAGIDSIALDLDLRGLLRGVVEVTRAEVRGLRVDARQSDAGIDLLTLWTDPSLPPATDSNEDWSGLPVTLLVRDIDVQADRLDLRLADGETVALQDCTLRAAMRFEGDGIAVDHLAVDAATHPDFGPLRLRAAGRYDPRSVVLDRFDVELGAQRLSMSGRLAALNTAAMAATIDIQTARLDLDRLPLDLPLTGVFDLTGTVDGGVDAPALTLRILTPGGPVRLVAALDLRPAAPDWAFEVQTWGLAVDAFVPALEPLDLDLRLRGEGSGLVWPDELQARVEVEAAVLMGGALGQGQLTGGLSLADGVVLAPDLVASTEWGRVQVDAVVDLLAQLGRARLQAKEVQLADLERVDVQGLRGSVGFVGDADADWSGSQPAVRASGHLDGRALGAGDALAVRRLRGPLWLDWSEGVAHYTGALRATGVTAPSTRVDDLRLRASGRIGEGGAMSGRAALTVTAFTAGPIGGDEGTGAVEWRGDDLVAQLDLLDAEHTVVGVDATADLRRKRLEMSRLVFSPTPDQRWVGEGVQTITLADDGFDDLRVVVRSADASLRASGSAHSAGRLAVDVEVEGFELSALEMFDPGLLGVEGRVDAVATARGARGAPVLTLEAAVDDLSAPAAVRGLDLAVTLRGDAATLQLDAAVAADAQQLATARGTLPLGFASNRPVLDPDGPWDLRVEVEQRSSADWNNVLADASLPAFRGGGQVQLSGSPSHPELRLDVAVEAPAADERDAWVGLDLSASVHHQQLLLEGAMREGAEYLATLEGSARLELDAVAASLLGRGPKVDLEQPADWVSDIDLRLVPDLPLRSLEAFVAVPPDVEGQLVGQVRIQGSPAAPTLDLALELRDGTLGAIALRQASVAMSPAAGGYELAAGLDFGGEGDLQLDAFLPVELRMGEALRPQLDRPGLRVDVSGEGVPLAVVAVAWPDMQEASGRLRLAGHLEGTLRAPTGDLRLSAEDAAFVLTSTGVAYDQGRFELVADRHAVALTGLHLRTSLPGGDPERGIEGTIDGELEARINGRELGEWRGGLSFDRTLVSANSDRFLRLAKGRVRVSGVPPAVRLDGSVEVEEARISLSERFFTGRVSKAHPPWLVVHRGDGSLAGDGVGVDDAEVEAAGIPDWLSVRLGVDLGDAAFLRARLPLGGEVGGFLGPLATMQVDAQSGGTLTAGVRDGDVALTGQVLVMRGTTVLFGKPFDLSDTSTVSFIGQGIDNPVLNLHATFDTRSYGLIEADITGNAASPVVTLSSEQYPSQDDVISLLLIGQPASEMSTGEGSEGASAAMMAMLLTTVGQTLGGLGEDAASDFVRPDLLVVGNETARVGKRLGRRVFVVVDIDNTADDQSSSYLTLTVEYSISGPWAAEFQHGSAGQDSFTLNWTRRYR